MNLKKLAFMFYIWLCVYPLVTGIIYIIRTFAPNLPVPGQTLIATLILVPVMFNWIVPFVKKRAEGNGTEQKVDTTQLAESAE